MFTQIKIIFLLFTFTFLLFTLSSPAFAQSATLPTTISPTSPLFTDMLVQNIFHTFSCLAVGQSTIGQPCLSYQLTKNAQGAIQSIPVLSQVNTSGGALGATTNIIGLLYQNPPVRTADYLASVGQSLGIVKEAQAQVVGSGAAVLNPILTLWQTSRNIAYVLMIIIFLIIGMMVMFRNKINPQTVITAQAALPGLVIGLIMITFSYFLAGLISDTAFIGTNVVGYYFASAQGKTNDPERINLTKRLENYSVFAVFGKLTGIVSREQATNALQDAYDELPDNTKEFVGWFAAFLAFQLVGPIGASFGPAAAVAGPALGLVSGLIAGSGPVQTLGLFLSFAAIFILVYAMLRLLLRLITSYLTIIFLTIIAPFQFLFASLPGRQGFATDWIMNLLGNILIFPAVIAVLYFVAFILGHPTVPNDFPLIISQTNQNTGFAPAVYAQVGPAVTFSESPTFPLFANLNFEFVKILIAFGALVALPTIPDIVIKAVGKASQAGQMIGQEIGGSTRSGQGYLSQHSGRMTQAGQSIGTGIAGESQYFLEGGQIVRKTTKLGASQYVGSWLGKRAGSAAPVTSPVVKGS